MSKNNQVTVKMDARVVYGLIAILAVVGIFAIGLWLGQNRGGSTAETGTTDPAGAVAPAANPGEVVLTGATPMAGAPVAGAQQPAAPGEAAGAAQNPVSVDQVPVGAAEPRLWVPEAAEANWTYDLGQIPADQATEKDFIIENAGTAELVIEDTSASCGCTAAAVGESVLAPGASTTLRVSYDPRVNKEFGRFVQKQIRIKSNDPLVPLAEFTVTADVAAQ